MRFLTVTFKDMLQSTRSFAGLMFMFAIPLLVTGLFFLMFGGVGDELDYLLHQIAIEQSSVVKLYLRF